MSGVRILAVRDVVPDMTAVAAAAVGPGCCRYRSEPASGAIAAAGMRLPLPGAAFGCNRCGWVAAAVLPRGFVEKRLPDGGQSSFCADSRSLRITWRRFGLKRSTKSQVGKSATANFGANRCKVFAKQAFAAIRRPFSRRNALSIKLDVPVLVCWHARRYGLPCPGFSALSALSCDGFRRPFGSPTLRDSDSRRLTSILR